MSYKSPSNARTSSLHKNPAQYNTNPISSTYSPYGLPKTHILDDTTSLSHTRHSRVKTSGQFTRTDIPVTASLELREKKLEEQFQTLLDRCSKSKEYIHSMQQAVFGDNNGDIRHISGGNQSMHVKSPSYSNITPSRRAFADTEQENRFFPRSEKNAKSFQYSTNDRSNSGYEERESEVVNLKKKILNRLKNKEIESHKIKERLRSATEEASDEEYPKAAENLVERDFSLAKVAKSPKKERDYVAQVEGEEYEVIRQEKEGKTNAERSLSRLKATLQEKEKVQQEKFMNAKDKCKELKNVLKEYVSKVTDLEEDLKKKEIQAREYEENMIKWQQRAIKEEGLAKEFERRNEILMKSEAEARSLNNEFKLQIAEQTEKLEELQGALKINKEKYRQGAAGLSDENDNLRAELESIKQSESVLRGKYEELQRESERLKIDNENNRDTIERMGIQNSEKNEDLKALRSHLEKMRNDKTGLEQKVKELQQYWEQSVEKIETERLKYEEEIAKLKQEHEKENVVKREKLKALKLQVRDSEKVTQKTAEDKRFADLEVERTIEQKNAAEKSAAKYKDELKVAKEEITTLREVINKLTAQNEETYRNLQVESDKVMNITGESRQLAKSLQNSEDKVGLLERDLKRHEESILSLKVNLKDYYNENTDLKGCIRKLESQLNTLYAHQDQELSTVEERVTQFGREIHHLKEENTALKLVQQELQQEIDILDEQRNSYKKKYKNLKKVNKALEKEIQDVEAQLNLDLRMKDVAIDKALEIEEYRGEIGHQRKLSSKLKVLEEIQGMIHSHRSQNNYV